MSAEVRVCITTKKNKHFVYDIFYGVNETIFIHHSPGVEESILASGMN
jgi:hypothetical protein